MSTIADYKAETLARGDVADILKFEPVERKAIKSIVNGRQEVTGYQEVEHTMEGSGRKLKKYDVHLVKIVKVDGKEVKQFVTEAIAVYDEGTPGEEVVVVTPVKVDRDTTPLEKYVRKLPYLNVSEMEIDTEAKNIRFTALKENVGAGTAVEVEVYAYVEKAKGQEATIKHVEIIK